MSRRMSCSMTADAVRARTKTVTRRHIDSWRTLKPGDRLTLIEKGMGLPKGSKQVVLAEVEITDVRVEPIGLVDFDEATREGFPEMDGHEFVAFWLSGRGHPVDRWCDDAYVLAREILCRRIEWRYLSPPCRHHTTAEEWAQSLADRGIR